MHVLIEFMYNTIVLSRSKYQSLCGGQFRNERVGDRRGRRNQRKISNDVHDVHDVHDDRNGARDDGDGDHGGAGRR